MRYAAAVLVLFFCSGLAVRAADADKAKLEKTVDTLLKAYNEGDAKTFNAQYAKTMAAVATEQTFNTMYKGQYMEKFGKFESKKAIDKETVAIGDFPLLVFEGKFAKAEKVKIAVNFTKDGDEFKVMQVRFDPM
jgi:hypothetical protein